MAIEMLLVEYIPNSNFLGLENNNPYTNNGRDAIKFAESAKCKFVIPVLIPGIPPVFRINYEKKLFPRKKIFTPSFPLALRSVDMEADINSQIKDLNYVTGTIGLYLRDIDVRERKVAYDSETGEILETIWDPNYKRIITL